MADIDIAYEPITVNSGPVTIGINGLDNIKVSIPDPIKTESTFKHPDTFKSDGKFALSIPDPIKTDSKFALSIPDPIKTDSKADLKAGIDLQPVVLDQCLRLSLGPLPATRICLPNHQHLGFTLFGIEIMGITLSGEASILVGEPQRQTHVVGGKASSADAGGDAVRIRLGH